jgi:hypothetical protein
VLCSAAAAGAQNYSSDYRYYHGAVAHAETVCAAADLCATISLRGGDVLTIYAESPKGCEQPTLRVIRRRSGQLLFSYELIPRSAGAHRQASSGASASSTACPGSIGFVDFDKGTVRMGVFPLGGGQLFVRFAAGTSLENTSAVPANIGNAP